MWIDIEHSMHFEFDGWIHQARMELRVQPRPSSHQSLREFSLAVGPPARVYRYVDWNGNAVHHFGIADYHERIEVTARSLVETHRLAVPEGAGAAAPPEPDRLGPLLDFLSFDGPVTRSPALDSLAAELAVPATAPIREQVAAIGALISTRFRYLADVTDWSSTTQDLLESGAGVCQDFAHLMLALLRLRGIPSRYLSGYLHVEGDAASQSHAWIEWYAGEHGWIGFDPTHDQPPDERYIEVASGRHYHDVPPNRGIYRGDAKETLVAEVRTSLGAPRDVAGQHEQIARIDLPVFRERPPLVRPEEDSAEQQPEQEKQQQQ